MAPPAVEPLPLYRPRDPQASQLWRVMDEHFATFQQVYDERFQAKYGFWRPIVERSVTAFLKCGDLQQGFARVRCPDCHHEMFVAFSCKQRCTCPSCHQKRASTRITGCPDLHPCGGRCLLAGRTPASGPDDPQTPAAARSLRPQADHDVHGARASSVPVPGRASRTKSAADPDYRVPRAATTCCPAWSRPSRPTANCCIGTPTSTHW